MAARRAAVAQHVLWLTLQRERPAVLAAFASQPRRACSSERPAAEEVTTASCDAPAVPTASSSRARAHPRWDLDERNMYTREDLETLATRFAEVEYQEAPDPPPPPPLPSPAELLAMDPMESTRHVRKWLSSHPAELSTAAQQLFRANIRRVINHIAPRRHWATRLTPNRKRVLLELWTTWLHLTANLDQLGALSPIRNARKSEYRAQWFDSLFMAILMRPLPPGVKEDERTERTRRLRKERRAPSIATTVESQSGVSQLLRSGDSLGMEVAAHGLVVNMKPGQPSFSGMSLALGTTDTGTYAVDSSPPAWPASGRELPPDLESINHMGSEIPPDLRISTSDWEALVEGKLPSSNVVDVCSQQRPLQPTPDVEEPTPIDDAQLAHCPPVPLPQNVRRPISSDMLPPLPKRLRQLRRRLVHSRSAGLARRVHARRPRQSQHPHYHKLHSQRVKMDESRTRALSVAVLLLKSLGLEPTRFQLQLVLQRMASKDIFEQAHLEVAESQAAEIRTVARSLHRLLHADDPPQDALSPEALAAHTAPRPSAGPKKNCSRDKRFLLLGAVERCLDELEAASLAGRSPGSWAQARDEMRPAVLKEIDRYLLRLNVVLEEGGTALPKKAQAYALWLLLRDALLTWNPHLRTEPPAIDGVVHGWNLSDPLVVLSLLMGARPQSQPDDKPRRSSPQGHADPQRLHSGIIRIAVAATRHQSFRTIVTMTQLLTCDRVSAQAELAHPKAPAGISYETNNLHNPSARVMPASPTLPANVAKYIAGSIRAPDDMLELLPLLFHIKVTPPAEDKLYISHSAKAKTHRRHRKRRAAERLFEIAFRADEMGIGKKLVGGSATEALNRLFRQWDLDREYFQ